MREEYTKKLCMNALAVSRCVPDECVYFETQDSTPHARFCFIVRGEVTVGTTMRQMTYAAGTLFYIPEGITYSASWQGEDGILFYAIDIISNKYDVNSTGHFEIQSIPALSTPETAACFAEIFRLFATEERMDRIRAVGMYYTFYADALPHLTMETPVVYNEAVLAAVSYIGAHYKEDFSMAALSLACNISESRLYHLFCEELGTTPVFFKNKVRVERAAQLLKTTDLPVSAVAEEVGYHSTAYFREIFKSYTGFSPAKYRKMR